MTFTIEPMINQPRHHRVRHLARQLDGHHQDRKWTAQFEHTIVVTDTGAEILTLP
ncbi:hypothetical protein GCM10018954_082660 [Kutzneria kofuensis]